VRPTPPPTLAFVTLGCPKNTVDAEKIKANYENGVLTVLVPKQEKAKAHLVKVEVGKPEKALKA